MLKLATLPRSRRERDWWRATPGRSGKGAALPPPADGPAERTEGCVTRSRRCARAGCHDRASQGSPAARARVGNAAKARGGRGGRRTSQGKPVATLVSSRRALAALTVNIPPRYLRWMPQRPRLPRRSQARARGALALCRAQRCHGAEHASGVNTAGGGRECHHIPIVRHRDPISHRASRSLSPHARRLGANVDQRQDGCKGHNRGWCRDRRVTVQDAVRCHGLRP